jgi:hypothetical protein
VQHKADAVAELQAEGLHLAGEAEFLHLRPHAAHFIDRHARLDQRYGVSNNFARLRYGLPNYRYSASISFKALS